MSSRALNNQWRQACARGFRLHGACFLNDSSANGTARTENVSSPQHLQLSAGGSMPTVFSSQDSLKTHTLHCHGEHLSRPLRDIKRHVSGRALRLNSKPLDYERVFHPAFLGDPKFSVRCLTTSSAVDTRPVVSRARHPRALSTSSTGDLKEKPEDASTDREGQMGVSEADEGVTGVTAEEPKHMPVEMPKITDEDRMGNIASWSYGVGDHVKAGDAVCEIDLEHFSAAVNVDIDGFIAKILVPAGSENVSVGTVLAVLVHSEEDIAFYQEDETDGEAPGIEETGGETSEVVETFSWKDVLKAVSRLREDKKLSEESASTLMSLARKKDVELLKAFEGCYEGDIYRGEIDDELFVVQARDIATITIKKENREREASEAVNDDSKSPGTPKTE